MIKYASAASILTSVAPKTDILFGPQIAAVGEQRLYSERYQ